MARKSCKRSGTSRRFAPGLVHLEDRAVPATLYVDVRIPGATAEGSPATFDQGFSTEQTLTYAKTLAFITASPTGKFVVNNLALALDAAAAIPGPDTVVIAQGIITPVDNAPGTLDIDQALTIIGAGIGKSVLAPTVDTAGEFDPVFNIPAGGNLTATDFSVAGSGRKLGGAFGFRDGGTGTLTRVEVQNVTFGNDGYGVDVLNTQNVTVQNSVISGYGRYGVGFTNSTGSVLGNTITGRGAGTFVNYGVQAIGGSTVLISGNTITNNQGVVPVIPPGVESDSSAAVFAARDIDPNTGVAIGPGATLTVIGNTFSGNNAGVLTGTGENLNDTSLVTSSFNNYIGNVIGIDATNSSAANNQGVTSSFDFFGAANGPTRTVADRNVDGGGPAGSPANTKAATGNSAIGNVRFNADPATPASGFDTRPVANPVLVAATPAAYLAAISNGGTTASGIASTVIAPTTPGTPVTSGNVNFVVTFNPGIALTGFPDGSDLPFDAADIVATQTTFTAGVANTPTAIPASQITVTPAVDGKTANVSISGITGYSLVSVSVRGNAALGTNGVLTGPSGTATSLFDPATAGPQLTLDKTPGRTLPVGGSFGPIVATASSPRGISSVTVSSSNPSVATATPASTSGNVLTFNLASAGGRGTATITVTATDAAGQTTISQFPVTFGLDRLYAVGSGAGGSAVAEVYDRTGAKRFEVAPFELRFTGGLTVATGDVNGDGVDDLVAGASTGGGPRVQVIDGKTQAVLADFFAFEQTSRVGVFVATGDVDGDGVDEVIVGAGKDGGPRVSVFRIAGGAATQLGTFFAFEQSFRSGATVGAGDITGDGKAEVIVGAAEGGGPRVASFSISATGAATKVSDFFAFDNAQRGGVYVAGVDTDGDGTAEIIAGSGENTGASRVRIFNAAGASAGAEINPYPDSPNQSVRVGNAFFQSDTQQSILTGPGVGGGPLVKIYTVGRPGGPLVFQDFAFDNVGRGGVFVG
jgi:hypothetical protein